MTRLLLPVGFLVSVSLVVISSISTQLFFQQLTWVTVGACVIAASRFFDWRLFLNYRWVIFGLYALTVFLLVLAQFTAPTIRNTKSWLVFGALNFQPVELAKISLILLFAHYFSRRHLSVAHWRTIILSFLYFIVPAALVAIQPDLGSSLVLFGLWFGFLLVSGLPRKRLLLMLGVFVVAGILIWNYGLERYQRNRVLGAFYPEWNLLSTNYSVNQSKIAIGSAGFFGKGYHQGSQTQRGFLTEPATDFIFSATIEEWGWIAGILIVAAFIFLEVSVLRVGFLADQNFEKFVCLGSAIVLGWQFFLNTGSATGMLPVVGVTFPFLSYGGSSLLTSFILLAIINSIAVRS